jgi:molecular chaperone DnaJ
MDLYIVLGVERGAEPSEIKRAYRRLARQLHPDINPGDREAAERFRLILDAYETLSDPDRRRRYDTGQSSSATADDVSSFGFAGFDFSTRVATERSTTFGELFEEVFKNRPEREPGVGSSRGADIHAPLSLSFEEAWHGVAHVLTLTRQEVCRTCEGTGARRVAQTRCMVCEGTGSVRSVRGHMVFQKNCPHCGGAGRIEQEPCAVCHGLSVEPRVETLTIRIPPGVFNGARVRVAGKGHGGLHGGSPGDLFIEVQVRPHEVYRREGDDVLMTVPIAVHEAALGARIELVTPDGPTRLKIPAGTQSGQRFRLRDRGAVSRSGQRGDLVVDVLLKLPKILDERSKALLREFGQINAESVRES